MPKLITKASVTTCKNNAKGATLNEIIDFSILRMRDETPESYGQAMVSVLGTVTCIGRPQKYHLSILLKALEYTGKGIPMETNRLLQISQFKEIIPRAVNWLCAKGYIK